MSLRDLKPGDRFTAEFEAKENLRHLDMAEIDWEASE